RLPGPPVRRVPVAAAAAAGPAAWLAGGGAAVRLVAVGAGQPHLGRPAVAGPGGPRAGGAPLRLPHRRRLLGDLRPRRRRGVVGAGRWHARLPPVVPVGPPGPGGGPAGVGGRPPPRHDQPAAPGGP